jgi:hypothetical protein
MLMNKYKDLLGALGSMLLCFLVSYPIIDIHLLNPNGHMYTYGGDALTIYYDMSYHVSHGSGTTFTGMNYPYGETIFMTDAQGALSIILSWINNNLFSISDYTVGIVNFLNSFSVLLCSFVIYYLLRLFDVKYWIALIFSALITLLSPQMFRLISHFGLAYLFVIPLCFVWIITKYRNTDFKYYDILLFFFILFLTLNNPYLGFITASTIFISGVYIYIANKFVKRKLYIAFIGLLPLVLAYGYLKIIDKINDRIKIQWGYFDLKSSPEGIIAPKGSLLDGVLKMFGKPSYEVDFEGLANFGIVTTVVLLTIIISLFLKKSNRLSFSAPKEFRPIIFSAFIFFIYSSGYLFLPFDNDFVEDKLGFLLMFKAVGRLIWPFYFAMTILAVLYLNHLSINLNKSVSIPIILLAAFIWNFEINSYVKPFFKDWNSHNFFSRSETDLLSKTLNENHIHADSFQAILSLPKIMTWTDNFCSEVNWSAQFNSMNISRTTGLPMINAMLSRMSIGQTAEKIELLANPLIAKAFVDKLPNKKDVLIVLGRDYPQLSSGEQFLVDISDTLYQQPNGFTLLKLPIDKINNNKYQSDARKKLKDNLHQNVAHIYNGFENKSSPYSYFGKGAKLFHKGDYVILNDTFRNPISDKYTFSIWTRYDHLKYGIGWFTCEIKNNDGQELFKVTPDTRKSNEVHGQWIRTELTFPVETNSSIRISFNTNRDIYIDELLIKPDTADIIIYNSRNKDVLYNGFKFGP